MNEYSDALQRSYQRAQQDYDNQMPPEDADCEVRGHRWHKLPGEAKDGTRFAKCVKCGKVEES